VSLNGVMTADARYLCGSLIVIVIILLTLGDSRGTCMSDTWYEGRSKSS